MVFNQNVPLPRHDETVLFSATSHPAADSLTPRAAYQLALAGRAAILDLRTGLERAAEGALPGYLSETVEGRVIALTGDDGVALGLPHIAGGFAAWRQAGMPVG